MGILDSEVMHYAPYIPNRDAVLLPGAWRNETEDFFYDWLVVSSPLLANTSKSSLDQTCAGPDQ